jgi:AraC-like DNA-binding protein
MIYPSKTDIVLFINGLVQSLQPYAKVNDISISFSSSRTSHIVHYQPFLLSQSIIQFICNLINLLPPKSRIFIRLNLEQENQPVRLEIENTGLNLIQIPEVISNSAYAFTSTPLAEGTLYSMELSPLVEIITDDNLLNNRMHRNNPPHFYKEIQKRFTRNFTLTERLIASLEKNRPQEAAFMQKINTIIKVNFENENFGTDYVCKAMFLSRTQLFRKMKSLVNQAPANYIRSIRLQKSKEMLETTDFTISEVAYKSGFQTINNFTKVFKKEYGIPPTVYRSNRNSATNR